MRADALAMPDLAAPLGWTLLHSFWQGLFVWCVLRFGVSRIPRPDLRAKLGLLGLAAFLTFQAITFGACLHGVSSFWGDHAGFAVNARGMYTPSAAPPIDGWLGATARRLDPWMPGVVVAWSLWTIYRLATCARGVRKTRQLLIAADPLPEPLLGRLNRLADRIGVRSHAVRFVAATITAGPGTVGWLRPFIFVPPALLLTMPPAQVEAIVAHELAHVLRRDYLLAAIQFVVEGLYTCNPFVRWIVVRLNEDAELACDRIAVRHVSDPAVYAHALRRVAEEAIASDRMVMAATGGSLVARVRWILQPPVERSGSAWAMLGFAGAFVAVLLAISTSTLASASASRTEARFLAERTFPQAVDDVLGYDGDVAAVRAAVTRSFGTMPGDVDRAITLLARAGGPASTASSPAQFRSAYATLDEVAARGTDGASVARIQRFLLHGLGADARDFATSRLAGLLSGPVVYARLALQPRDARRLYNTMRYQSERYRRVDAAMRNLPDVLDAPARLEQTLREMAIMTSDQRHFAQIALGDSGTPAAERFAAVVRGANDPQFAEFLSEIERPSGPIGRTVVVGRNAIVANLGQPVWSKTEASP